MITFKTVGGEHRVTINGWEHMFDALRDAVEFIFYVRPLL